MRDRLRILIALATCLVPLTGCRQPELAPPTEAAQPTRPPLSATTQPSGGESLPLGTATPAATDEWHVYRNDDYGVLLSYPADWVVKSEGYQSVILIPLAETAWEPATPAEIPQDPAVEIEFGEYIRERTGPTYFPETVTFPSLRAWIEEKISNQEAEDLSVRSINGFQTLELTQLGESGCERVVYWRPLDLKSLVRFSTGCDSPYMDQFHHILDTVQQAQ